MAGDVGNFDVILAGFEVEGQAVADNGELLVVDGQSGRHRRVALSGVLRLPGRVPTDR